MPPRSVLEAFQAQQKKINEEFERRLKALEEEIARLKYPAAKGGDRGEPQCNAS